jgi:hypothetical protein
VTSPPPAYARATITSKSPSEAVFIVVSPAAVGLQVELMRIWALQRPDLNRLQKTITTACEKERYDRPWESALIYARETNPQRPTRESSKTHVLLAKNRREKNPQLPAKQGESRDVTFPRHTHVPPSPPKAQAKPFSLFAWLILSNKFFSIVLILL